MSPAERVAWWPGWSETAPQ